MPLKNLLRTLVLATILTSISFATRAQPLSLQWAHTVTGTTSATGQRVAVDAQNNVYIAGQFSGTADFDPGSGTANLTSPSGGGSHGYVAKYDAQGNYLFAMQLDGIIGDMAVDNNGNIYVAGRFDSTVDFDPGAGTANLTSAGSYDFFVARYSTSGSYQSAFRLGSTANEDRTPTIAADASGNVYLTGGFSGTIDFDPGAGTTDLSATGVEDIFMAKYTSSNTLAYAFKLFAVGINNVEYGSALIPLSSGEVYVGGRFAAGTIDLDPGPGVANFASQGANLNGFVAKYSATGSYISGATFNGVVNRLAIDASGNFYAMGTIPDSMDADPGPGKAMLYNIDGSGPAGYFDTWIGKYDASGNYLHAKSLRGYGVYAGTGLATNGQSTLYVAGRFQDTLDLLPAGTGGQRISAGGLDGFLARYDATGLLQLATSFGSTAGDVIEHITTDGQGGLWAIGYFNGTVDFDPGPATANLSETSTGNSLFFARYSDAQTGIGGAPAAASPVRVFGGDDAVIVDFTALKGVDAEVKVLNILGQTVATARHGRNDMLRIPLPEAAGQVYVVMVRNAGSVHATKVWVR